MKTFDPNVRSFDDVRARLQAIKQALGVVRSTGSISSTPTAAELTGLLGEPEALSGPFAIVDSGGSGSNIWAVFPNGTGWAGVQLAAL